MIIISEIFKAGLDMIRNVMMIVTIQAVDFKEKLFYG